MTHARTLAAFALVVAAFAVLASILTSGTPAVALQAAPPAVEALAPVEVDPFLRDLLGDAGIPANADELLLAADRVCEGVTAGVSVAEMSTVTMRDLGITGEEARHLVNLAATTRCVA